jgi:site-specific DNA-methyltransferase (adenine-specific)
MNHLYFGDCLNVLRDLKENYPQPFIDLIYIDPPFNSKRNYNVLFESMDMTDANAQKQAFADTWTNVAYMDELHMLAEMHKDLYDVLTAFSKAKSISDSAVAYLTTMALRIWYMHKILKDTGSFYLHCDETMSHYLKLVCDMIFEEKNFRNEIVWQRTNAHNMKAKYYGRVHDVILFYTKSSKYIWNEQYTEYSPEQLSRFKEDENGKLYKAENLTFSSPNPNRQFEWRGVRPPANRSWGASKEQLEKWWKEGRILKKQDGNPRMDGLKIFLEDLKGKLLNDWWGDVSRVGNTSSESLGYPTQKPEALMERIIKASSNEGDVVADFFCGCGTTIAVAQKLNRKWLGADISHLAIRLIVKRLVDSYGEGVKHNIKIHGFPADVASARELAEKTDKGRILFQEWVIEVLLNGVVNEKKVADGGYDGYLTYQTEAGKEFVLIEIKSGKVNVTNIREFIRVIDKEKANAGIFVCFENTVTKEMLKEAKSAGHIKIGNVEFGQDKIQIMTIESLMSNHHPNLPNVSSTFKKAQRKETKGSSYGLFD